MAKNVEEVHKRASRRNSLSRARERGRRRRGEEERRNGREKFSLRWKFIVAVEISIEERVSPCDGNFLHERE